MTVDIAKNVLKKGKAGIKENMLEAFDEFIDEYVEELWEITSELIKLKTDNAVLRERLAKSVKLPEGAKIFLPKDGEKWILLSENDFKELLSILPKDEQESIWIRLNTPAKLEVRE